MVRKERLELSRVAPLDPKSSASTNSATLAVLVTEKIVLEFCQVDEYSEADPAA